MAIDKRNNEITILDNGVKVWMEDLYGDGGTTEGIFREIISKIDTLRDDTLKNKLRNLISGNQTWSLPTTGLEYMIDDIVSHNGVFYYSDIDYNTSEPGVANWTSTLDLTRGGLLEEYLNKVTTVAQTINSAITINNTNNATDTSSGSIISAGGLGIAKDVHVGGDVFIGGNANIAGTLNYINTANLLVEDKIIQLGTITTPTDLTADGGGITLLGDTNKTILWDNTSDSWLFNQSINSTGSITGSRLHSTIATGTAPLSVQSTTKVTNLNADTVDGYHVNEIGLPLFKGFKSNGLHALFSGDLDTLTYNSIYNIADGGVTNGPTTMTEWGFIHTMVHSNTNSYTTQIIYDMNGGNPTFIRHRIASVWGEWYEYLDSKNDQTISGTKTFTASVYINGGTVDFSGTNTKLGVSALTANTTGGGNTAVGTQALLSNTTGGGNTAVGTQAFFSNTTGEYNTAVGYGSLNNVTTGINNSGLGYNSGVTGWVLNTHSHTVILGADSTVALRCKVALTTWSDQRDKTDILDVTNGLDFINKLRPVWFNWDERSNYKEVDEDGNIIFDSAPDGSLKSTTRQVGFLAQEIEQTETIEGHDNYVVASHDESNDTHTVTHEKLLPFLVDAVKTLTAKIEAQQLEINELKGL